MASEKTPASIPNSGWCQVCGSALNVSREPNVESKVGVPPTCPAAGAVGRTLELPGPAHHLESEPALGQWEGGLSVSPLLPLGSSPLVPALCSAACLLLC